MPETSLSSGLARPKVDAQGPELGGAGILRGAAEHIRSPGDLEVLEPSRSHHSLELCFQQSAGNSPTPQIDVPFGFLGDRSLDQDISDLEPASGFEHAIHLLENSALVRAEIDCTIRDDYIRPLAWKG